MHKQFLHTQVQSNKAQKIINIQKSLQIQTKQFNKQNKKSILQHNKRHHQNNPQSKFILFINKLQISVLYKGSLCIYYT